MADKINLPNTKFSMKANLSKNEPKICENWDKDNIYEKILNKNSKFEKYILHDGPPYANGEIHLGHALNKILKDIIVKYELMNRKYVPFVPGWDCHGLPIEYQLLKEMNLDKNHVDQLKFRKKAAKFAEKFIKIQKEGFKRLGVFADWEHPYLTLLPEYEGNIIKVFRNLVKKGYIYRGLKPVYWCNNCETALAEAEIEYKDIVSTSIFVKFPMTDEFLGEKDLNILIWTTTPWTLPSNTGVAFHPEYEYSIIKIKDSSNKNLKKYEKIIICKDLIDKLKGKLEIIDFETIKTFVGKEIENKECLSPFRQDSSKCILATYVTIDDGTGIVHIAPGHGTDDYIAGKKYNLPIVAPIDSKGNFNNEVEDKRFLNMNIWDANSFVIKDLDSRGSLVKSEDINHSYPHCWRCKKPVIFRATNQWFLNMEHENLRERLINICKNVKWIPEYGYNRITAMLANRPDWCLSRQRLWGTPIPAFYCEDCNELILTDETIKKVEDLFREKGSDAWFYVTSNEILGENFTCPKCHSKSIKKETDIFDVWFDSGVSSEAVLKERNNLSYPADLYLEGSDQHRGWFQASLILAVALNDKVPFKNVLTHGFTVDKEGKKMSKSASNGISPKEIMDKFGADILRLWISSINYQEDMRISDDIILQMVDAYRKIRNTAKYILGNLNDFDYNKEKLEYSEMKELDKWVLLKLSLLIKIIKKHYDERNFYLVYKEFYNFCNTTLSSIYFDIIKDRLYVMSKKSKDRCSASTVLYHLANILPRMIAPILPFTANEIWKDFVNNPFRKENIFLEDYIGISDDEKTLISSWENKNIDLSKWNTVFEFRKVLLKKIEELRLKKVIGNSLEAKIIIFLEKEIDFINLNQNLESELYWAEIAIVSKVEIKIVNNLEESDFSLDNNKIYVKVEKMNGEKCPRCWNWTETLVNVPDYEEKICQRCEKFLKEW